MGTGRELRIVLAVPPGELGVHENEARLEPLGSRDRFLPVPGESEHPVAERL